MSDRDRSYILISPCRNEAEYIRRTLDSVASQTIPPREWIVVDDGSTDETPQILREYQSRLRYLRVITRQDRGKRSVGPGVIEAFYEGYENIKGPYQYLCKLDVDLELPPRYFELLMDIMEADPRVGTVSGKAFYVDSKTGRTVLEKIRDHVSLGMTKFFRKECFEEIGGFVREVMWDGIDCHRCRMLGWKAYSIDSPELRFEHLRPMGSSQQNIYVGRTRHGYGQYFMGTSFPFITASAATRMFSSPVFLGSFMMWWGYVRAMIHRRPRYDDQEFIQFLRRWQRISLRKGTELATKIIDEEQKSVWEKKWVRTERE